MTTEEWRPIAATYGRYEVSSLGRVRNSSDGGIVPLRNNQARLHLGGGQRARFHVARLVKDAFGRRLVSDGQGGLCLGDEVSR